MNKYCVVRRSRSLIIMKLQMLIKTGYTLISLFIWSLMQVNCTYFHGYFIQYQKTITYTTNTNLTDRWNSSTCSWDFQLNNLQNSYIFTSWTLMVFLPLKTYIINMFGYFPQMCAWIWEQYFRNIIRTLYNMYLSCDKCLLLLFYLSDFLGE